MIAADVQGRAAALSAGMQARIAARINDAMATMPKEQHAGIIQGLEVELAATLATIAAGAAAELRGRQQAAIMANGGKKSCPEHGGGEVEAMPERPVELIPTPQRTLQR